MSQKPELEDELVEPEAKPSETVDKAEDEPAEPED
jgi:hypothetical protein